MYAPVIEELSRRARYAMSLLHRGLYQAALRHGATEQELMEANWVPAEMRAGGAYAHSALAINKLSKATANSA
jgi:alkylhydroperoxidase/carboxymuconolactone decarboxylase family protein YurZ